MFYTWSGEFWAPLNSQLMETSQELRMLSLSLFIQGSLRLLFSICGTTHVGALTRYRYCLIITKLEREN